MSITIRHTEIIPHIQYALSIEGQVRISVCNGSNTFKTTIPESSPDIILRAKEVKEITGLSRTTLWRLESKGDFPRRVSLGVGSVGWRYSEVKD